MSHTAVASAELLRRLHTSPSVTHVENVPPAAGDPVEWPSWVPSALRSALAARGVTRPWRHQAAAATLAREGRHVVVATGTASGKSLAYLLPALSALTEDPKATVLYLAPTKALAADQLRAVTALAPEVRPACYDGDTPSEEREWIRANSRFILTNPDMLHHSILPNHHLWSTFLRRLTYVVVDECHVYRGLFGSHVAHVLRRLRRVAGRYAPVPFGPGASDAVPGAVVPGAVTPGAVVPGAVTPGAAVPAQGDGGNGAEAVVATGGAGGGASPGAAVTTGIAVAGTDVTDDVIAIRGDGIAAPHSTGTAPDPSHLARPNAPIPAQGDGNARSRTTSSERVDGPAGSGAEARRRAGAPRRGRNVRQSRAVFVLASATSGDPAAAAERLTGLPVTAVTVDGSPRGGVTFALWEPPLLPPGLSGDPAQLDPDDDSLVIPSVRRSALRETADLLTDAITHGVRTLAFVRSRRGAEVVASIARRSLDEAVPGLGARVAAYRAGYLREERRALERALLTGELLGMASTNALELGVDLVGLDAVLICGYPGTRASLWQQAGRAGRSGGEALAVLVARDDPLDTYLVHHPDALFGRPVEATVLDPANPYVLAPQLCCAANEAPLTADDLELFGGAPAEATVAALVRAGSLRRRPTGYFWTHRTRPDVDLRGGGGSPINVVESATGRLLGTVDPASSHFIVHPGAVYLHQGSSFVVEELHLDDAVALVRAEEPDWTTHARDVTSLAVASVRERFDAGPVSLFLGEVDVHSQVVSYQRRRIGSGEVIDTRPLDLPARELHTVAVWFTITPEALEAAGVEPADFPGALHAAEHAAIGLLPLVATCDRWDIGGISTAAHPDTGLPTVFVYDGHPGGAGFAERAHAVAADWLRATREAISSCACETGCPACVQSPKCGNGNNPLAKDAAVLVLDAVLARLPASAE
ncbi:DEAD/DEAH box helicase domain-containing protein [Catenuloplanes nepalensis]|uniref:DEAD/DEAH box helicase domain-containing protein n=1 Tax=Catenuloplanes nepalensis TaxID=587533 RepID=A0ABT9N5F9_9ACTN|nr:DEAD/DEAH box helicase [Catenuloplanes nepalensis]MDP9798923.1 DEAD/DEAH box helicase domain-containing protein [Catenuloplanes nepalensis]